MTEPYLLVVGHTTINVLATTCPRCHRGREEYCGHFARLVRAVRERWSVERDQRERSRLSALLSEMDRNRAALAASGPWDLAQAAQGAKRMPTWRQSPHHNPRHVSKEQT